MSDVLGYIRVSTADQTTQLQRDELAAVGCYRIWEETASGARDDRPVLSQVLDALRPGDQLVVWRLDRLGRNLAHLLATVALIEERGASFRSLRDQIDTSTPAGRFTFHLFGAIAQFERELIRERTVAGLAAARANGRAGGRPAAVDTDKANVIRDMLERGRPRTEIARVLGISRSTLYRHIERDHPDYVR